MSISQASSIKALLFDSGRVLNQPATGHWFISPHFFDYIDKQKFFEIAANKRRSAFRAAQSSINEQTFIANSEDEYQHFLKFYQIFAEQLPKLALDKSAIQAIAADLVFNREKYTFFDDAMQIIPALSRRYKLAVVSDAWPSLEDVFIRAKMRDYFSAFVISAKLGTAKPNPRMYQAALQALDCQPEQALFIDDSIRNCDGAERLGIHALVLTRDWRLYAYRRICHRRHSFIRDLYALNRLLGKGESNG